MAFSPASQKGYITTMPERRTRHKKYQNPMPHDQKNENQTQRTFTMALAVLLQDNLAMATDPASPASLHVAPATTLTNEMDD